MKAKLHDGPFSDPAWVFERKLDGIRAAVRREGGEVTLTSRTGRGMSSTYPELIEALEAEAATDFLADGEIVAFEGSRTSFERLQGRMGIHDPRLARLSGIPVFLYLFALLEFDGHDLTGLPLRERKSALRRAFAFEGPVRYTPHRNERGEEPLDGFPLRMRRACSPISGRRHALHPLFGAAWISGVISLWLHGWIIP